MPHVKCSSPQTGARLATIVLRCKAGERVSGSHSEPVRTAPLDRLRLAGKTCRRTRGKGRGAVGEAVMRQGMGMAFLTLIVLAQAGVARGEPLAASLPAVSYVTGVDNAEDLVAIPGTRWIVTGGLDGPRGAGGFFLIDTRARRAQALRPVNATAKPDPRRFPGCPGAPPQTVAAHGINLRPGPGRRATLYAVNHTGREAIEVFTLDHAPAVPTLTWVGCVPLPAGSLGNAVAPLPDGGIAVTLMNAPEYFASAAEAKDPRVWTAKFMRGETTGHLAVWHPASGWRKVPGTEGSGSNGVEVSPDGRWAYVARWGNREILHAPLRPGGAIAVTKVDFSPDNLRWGDDGRLWTAGSIGTLTDYFRCLGKPGCHNDYVVARIDPASLAVVKVAHPGTAPAFSDATAAAKVGGGVWLGANPGDRVAYLPLGD